MDPACVRVLLVEDNPGDVVLLTERLRKASDTRFELHGVSRLSEALERLRREAFDIMLLDLSLPDSTGLDTVKRAHAAASRTATIVLTTLHDEALAMEALRQGAQDYLIKGETGGRALARAMRYAIERQQMLMELQATLEQVRRLSGLLPICATCKKIRDDRGYWTQVEQYIDAHSEAHFTHAICPECARRIYGECAGPIQ